MVVKSATKRVQIGTVRYPPDSNRCRIKIGGNVSGAQVRSRSVFTTLCFGAIQAASGLASHFEHFSDLVSHYKRKSEFWKIARLRRLRHVLLRSSGHHLDTQISQASLGNAKRILDRDRSPHKSGPLPPRESIVARCQKMCQLPFWIPQDSE